MNDAETRMRRAIREQLLASGAPPQSVDTMVDLGFHAAQRACESILTTVMAAPGKAELVQTTLIAVGVVRARLQGMEDSVRETMIAAGMPCETAKVEASHG